MSDDQPTVVAPRGPRHSEGPPTPGWERVAFLGLLIVGVGILVTTVGLIIVGISGNAQQDAITALSTIGGALAGGISGWLIRGKLHDGEDEER